jgi:hypothetical protein
MTWQASDVCYVRVGLDLIHFMPSKQWREGTGRSVPLRHPSHPIQSQYLRIVGKNSIFRVLTLVWLDGKIAVEVGTGAHGGEMRNGLKRYVVFIWEGETTNHNTRKSRAFGIWDLIFALHPFNVSGSAKRKASTKSLWDILDAVSIVFDLPSKMVCGSCVRDCFYS